MRIGAVVLLSLLGMSVSSAMVAWLTPAASAADDSSRASWKPAASPRAVGDAQAEVAAEPVSSTFSVEGPLRLEGRLGHAVLPGEKTNETYVLVEVGAPSEAAIEARAPVNLSIVIDRSGSMKGQRLDNAVAAARGMVSRLRPNDTVSLVAYDERAQLLVAPTTVERLDRFGFERTLADLRGGGNTCISCGIDVALAQLRTRSEAVNRILLLSDGVANRGLTRTEDFRSLGDLARRERTAVASIGVDVDYDERSLFALSQASNGHHYFVEDPTGLPSVFEQEARSLIGTVADRVDVEVALADGVELVEVIARGHRREGDRVALNFGSFNAGEDKSALLRVRVAPGVGDRAIADVRLVYRELAAGQEHATDGGLGLTQDPTTTTLARLDPRVEERLGRKDTLDALLSANEAFAEGDLGTARIRLDAARDRIRRRRSRSGAARDSKVDRNFEQQLQALGGARAGFDDAAQAAPRPKAASKSRKGKKAIRRNAQVANPFG